MIKAEEKAKFRQINEANEVVINIKFRWLRNRCTHVHDKKGKLSIGRVNVKVLF
ncbi:hypothetical protein Pint_23142 [Pistacia integerrima]|uniref:Uncharacterized protein n=1 Tax=Pistacia integerrima TaxID=434235 RepID=A0ACC0YQ50_9ROSI|nr:hypothetical protein Pint_23142 [Pistacia integerrima]